MLTDLKRRFAYEMWANDQMLAHLASLPSVPERAMMLMGHLASARKIWLTRIHGESSRGLALWPNADLAACHRLFEDTRQGFNDLLTDIDRRTEQIDRVVRYATQAGDPWETTLRDIVTHVLNHGTHHRAQILTILRDAGLPVIGIDYILFVRSLNAQTG